MKVVEGAGCMAAYRIFSSSKPLNGNKVGDRRKGQCIGFMDELMYFSEEIDAIAHFSDLSDLHMVSGAIAAIALPTNHFLSFQPPGSAEKRFLHGPSQGRREKDSTLCFSLFRARLHDCKSNDRLKILDHPIVSMEEHAGVATRQSG